MRSFITFVAIVACTISRCFSNTQEILRKENTVIKATVRVLEFNSFDLYSRLPAVAGDQRADLVSWGFDSVVISKRFCGVRLFDIFGKI